ncbi:hypothetical protein Dimus_001004, partial [Dionaea muscipula]
MTPSTTDPVLKPRREAWIRCVGVPLHARSPNPFISTRKNWGDILSVKFGYLENGSLEDGRVLLLIDVVSFVFSGFMLQVNGKTFECWVLEECLALLLSRETEVFREEHHIHGLSTGAEVAMADAEEKHRTQASIEMSPLADGDMVTGQSGASVLLGDVGDSDCCLIEGDAGLGS